MGAVASNEAATSAVGLHARCHGRMDGVGQRGNDGQIVCCVNMYVCCVNIVCVACQHASSSSSDRTSIAVTALRQRLNVRIEGFGIGE